MPLNFTPWMNYGARNRFPWRGTGSLWGSAAAGPPPSLSQPDAWDFATPGWFRGRRADRGGGLPSGQLRAQGFAAPGAAAGEGEAESPAGPIIAHPSPNPSEPWDFWQAMQQLFDEQDIEDFNRLREYVTGQQRWRVPRYAQDMLGLANLARMLGDEESARQIAFQTISQGFQRPTWNLASIMGPLMQQWGW